MTYRWRLRPKGVPFCQASGISKDPKGTEICHFRLQKTKKGLQTSFMEEGGRGFDSRGRNNTQGLKITEK